MKNAQYRELLSIPVFCFEVWSLLTVKKHTKEHSFDSNIPLLLISDEKNEKLVSEDIIVQEMTTNKNWTP
jgi:hypothetical protein